MPDSDRYKVATCTQARPVFCGSARQAHGKVICRQYPYWENDGDARIVWATGDGFLIAVDAKTGLPAPDFGENGRVDLTDGVPRATRGERDILNLLPLTSQSPPMIIRDTIIVGSTINDRTITQEGTPGFARAFDARTGRHQWDFHTVPQKQGFVYVFDRVTGEPVWPIEELPVATDADLDGELLSPTQPFPTKPAAFEYQGTSIDDLVDFTPEIRRMAVAAVDGFRLGPLYTPQMLRGTVMRPSVGGGANWSGAAVDPETGFLYVPATNAHSTIRLTEPEGHETSNLRYVRRSLSAGPVMPRGLPLWKPPYTRMTAIDMNTGEHAWMIPTGNGDRIRNHPMLRNLDLPPLGGDASRSGPRLTKTLLIYALTAGGADGGPRLAAYDKASGAEIASLNLPSGALGSPMTYLLDGVQHIALTVGGEVPGLIVFRLPG